MRSANIKVLKEKKKKKKKECDRERGQSVSYPRIGPSHFSTSVTGMSFLKA